MRDSERYRLRAERAERLARGATSQDHRQGLLRVAAEWLDLADRAARDEPPSDARTGRAAPAGGWSGGDD